MSHISVQRFSAGDRQERGPEHQDSDARVLQQESQGVGRIDGGKNAGPMYDWVTLETVGTPADNRTLICRWRFLCKQ